MSAVPGVLKGPGLNGDRKILGGYRLGSVLLAHRDWLRFARRWAELTALIYGPDDSNDNAGTGEDRDIRKLQSQVDAAFTAWLAARFAGLSDLPPALPVMLHHILRKTALLHHFLI